MKYIIKPTEGVNEILLGSSKSNIHKIIGQPERSYGKTDSYDESRFQVSYDRNDNVEYIEVYADHPDEIQVFLNEINVFETKKTELNEYIQNTLKVSVDLNDPEYPYSCIYKDINLSLWNDVDPSGFDEDDIKMMPEEYKDSFYFKTIGVGIKGYYK